MWIMHVPFLLPAAAAAAAAQNNEPEMKTMTVDFPKDFDPLAGGAAASAPPKQQQQTKPDEAPTHSGQEGSRCIRGHNRKFARVMESYVPVLLDA